VCAPSFVCVWRVFSSPFLLYPFFSLSLVGVRVLCLFVFFLVFSRVCCFERGRGGGTCVSLIVRPQTPLPFFVLLSFASPLFVVCVCEEGERERSYLCV